MKKLCKIVKEKIVASSFKQCCHFSR